MKITAKLKTVKNNFDGLKKRIRRLQNEKVFYGYFAEQGSHSEWNIDYAELMAIHEYGTEDIPARPVFSITLFQAKNSRNPVIKSALSKYFYKLETSFDPNRPLADIGQGFGRMTGDKFGDSNVLIPNADYTVSEKGFDSPLVWTGELRANIAYKTTIRSNIELVY